jgi:uncharacterized protein (TIGR02246 family)
MLLDTAIEAHVARIRALDQQWLEATARRDLDGMMAIYAPDARELLPELPPMIGTAAIRAFYSNLMGQLPRFAHEFDAQEITVGAAGDLAVVQGRYRFTPDTQLPSQVQSGKFVGVWRRGVATGGLPSTSRIVTRHLRGRLRPNKRMQLPGASFVRNVG